MVQVFLYKESDADKIGSENLSKLVISNAISKAMEKEVFGHIGHPKKGKIQHEFKMYFDILN